MWEHFPFELEHLRKGRHVHLYQKIMSKKMDLKIFNSMFDCKNFFESRLEQRYHCFLELGLSIFEKILSMLHHLLLIKKGSFD